MHALWCAVRVLLYAVCEMLVLTRCSSFPSRGRVGGAQGEEPKDNPTPTERRDRSLKAQGPIPPAPTLTGWDRRATPRCYCLASPGRGAEGPTQPGETRTLLTLANMDCFLGGCPAEWWRRPSGSWPGPGGESGPHTRLLLSRAPSAAPVP